MTAQYEPALRRLLYQPGYKVYAILDGASVSGMLEKFHQWRPDHVCLYRGELAPDLAHTAPYLVHLDHKNPVTPWILENGWGEHWGVFITSDANLKVLRKHLRKFLMVYDQDNKPVYFRYYDPRVLNVYMPECGPAESETLFGPVTSYAFEGEHPNEFIRYWPTDDKPRREEVDLNRVTA